MGLAILIVFAMMNFYLWTLLITFRFSLRQIYRNSFKFVFINFKMNLLCGLILTLLNAIGILIALLISYMIVWMLLFLFTVCCIPAFRFLIIQYCTFPAIKKYIIDPYYAEHPGEDVEKRRDLGLNIAEDDDEDDPNAPVFED